MPEFETEHNQGSSDDTAIDGGTAKKVSKGSRWSSLFRGRYSKHILFALVFMVIGGVAIFVNAATTTSSLWSTSTIPKLLSDPDTKSVELGVKFSSKYTGQVTGVRFYKSAQNTGTHTGTLWDNNGNALATVTFTNETASGWQTANFPQPVTIAANVAYVISYHAPAGHYSSDNNYFSKSARTNGPLTAPRSSPKKPNGVYTYSSSTAFPTSTNKATNYWVDVVFTTGLVAPPVSAAPPASVVATQSGSSVVVTWTAGSSSSSITGYKIYRNGGLLTTVGNVLTHTDTALTAGTTYQYNVATVDANGTSPLSVTSAVTYNVTPPPPPPSGARIPWKYPFASDSFWNTSVGSGATYLSTSNAQHTQLVDAGGAMNAADWSDPVYRATTSDPLVTVQHVSYLPAGWADLTNTQIGTTSGEGTLVKQYTNIRIPASATWQSNNNTDRKVIVVQPDGIDAVEMHKFYRTSDPTLIFTTNLSRNDMRNSGLTQGAIASGISPMGGLIRNFEVAAARAGDVRAISHVLKMGLPNRKLIPGQRWPARTDDGDAETAYSGLTQYGTMIVLDKAVNIEALTYNGAPLVPEAKALAYALQDYGGYVLIRAGSGPVGLQVEARSVDATAVTNMKNVWSSVLVPRLRIVTNSANVGTLNADRTPVNPDLIAGGGIRRLPALPGISSVGPW